MTVMFSGSFVGPVSNHYKFGRFTSRRDDPTIKNWLKLQGLEGLRDFFTHKNKRPVSSLFD